MYVLPPRLKNRRTILEIFWTASSIKKFYCIQCKCNVISRIFCRILEYCASLSKSAIQYMSKWSWITTNNISIDNTTTTATIDSIELIYMNFLLSISRLLEMRMPRSSSFSVRDILDLPQMKNNSTTSDSSNTSPTHTTDISSSHHQHHQRFHGKAVVIYA